MNSRYGIRFDNEILMQFPHVNTSQMKCFNTPLQFAELQGLIAKVGSQKEGGVRDDALTEEGFLHLNMTFLWKGQPETTWKILTRHGYASDLKLSEEFLYPRLDVPSDCSVELSQKGYQFLTDIFELFDKVDLSSFALLYMN